MKHYEISDVYRTGNDRIDQQHAKMLDYTWSAHELFADDERVRLAPTAVMFGNAASLCMAAVAHAGEASDAKALNAKYLQITKAEKDRLEKKI